MPNDAANSWLRWTEPRRHSNCAAFLRMPHSQGHMQSQSCVRHAITRSGIGSFGESRPVSRMVTGAMAGAVPQFGPVVDSLEPRDLPRALTNVGIASTRFWSDAGVSADAPTQIPLGNDLTARVLAEAFTPELLGRLRRAYKDLRIWPRAAASRECPRHCSRRARPFVVAAKQRSADMGMAELQWSAGENDRSKQLVRWCRQDNDGHPTRGSSERVRNHGLVEVPNERDHTDSFWGDTLCGQRREEPRSLLA
jgi:hypothetical protein